MLERKVNKFNEKLKRFAVLFAMVIAFVSVYEIQVNAKDMATLTKDSTTFTGSINFTTVSGPAGYYTLKLSSSISANYLYENVTLKSSAGTSRPSICASGYNTTSVSATTGIFADGYYTMKGYYYYSVKTYKNNSYTFSTTY